jgi:hypothetical protein
VPHRAERVAHRFDNSIAVDALGGCQPNRKSIAISLNRHLQRI